MPQQSSQRKQPAWRSVYGGGATYHGWNRLFNRNQTGANLTPG